MSGVRDKNRPPTTSPTIRPQVGAGLTGGLAVTYQRGQRLHERVRQAAREASKVKKSDLCQAVARELGVSPAQLQHDAKFAAVDSIVGHCGAHARHVLLGGRHHLTGPQIESLSRKAPPMQKAQIASLDATGRLKKWRSYSDLVRQVYPDGVGDDHRTPPQPNPVPDVPPLETWDYREVVSRLKRAAGLVAKNVLDVPRLACPVSPELKAQALGELDFLIHCAAILRQFLAGRSER